MSQFTSITTEQIERFFEGLCTPEEAEAVSEYLQEHPDIVRPYIQRDWNAAAADKSLPKGYEREMLQEIKSVLRRQESASQGGKLITMRRVAGVAAIVAALTISIWLLLPENKPADVKTATARTEPPARKATAQWTIIHSTGHDTIHLADGSTVVLFANSTLRYPEPFEPQRRTLALDGKALFSVAKDEKRPFVVTSGAIETTVLGTEFSVTDSLENVQVKLYTGRIRLHANGLKENNDIELTPGQQMDYVNNGKRMLVSRWDKKQMEQAIAVQQYEDPVPSEPVVEQQLDFDNEPLPRVMDRLAACYHLTLTYKKEQIGNIYFTGTVSTSDSLTTTLHLIASMNELTIIPGKKGYTIRKRIP